MELIGIDTGGTFTDLVSLDTQSGNLSVIKVPSTPDRPSEAPLVALKKSRVKPDNVERIVIGTTIATNARLQKHGSTVIYLGTSGHQDVPLIARTDRKEAFNPAWPKPDAGVLRRHTMGVDERIDHKGNVLKKLGRDELIRIGDWVEKIILSDKSQDWALAINFLFSYLNPVHEKRIGKYLSKRFPNIPISISHIVAPIWREYDRATTVITDAFIKKVIGEFSREIEEEVRQIGFKSPLSLMKSNGGHAATDKISDVPVQMLLSGLAGGVIAGKRFSIDHSNGNSITLDMGGTSADVGLIENGDYRSTSEYEIEWGVPVNALFIDYKTIGAGGGSIASIDSGGLLKVGPESAGAYPGPACYGNGGREPTVTDANVVLGRLDPNFFLGGEVNLEPELSMRAIEKLGRKIGLDVYNTALAILSTAAANMADAIRLLTVDRGLDARNFSLISFGGAGPLHASEVAKVLGIGKVVIPPHPGLCSALGTVLTDLRVDRARTVYHRTDNLNLENISTQLTSLVDEAKDEIKRDGNTGNVDAVAYLNMRYLGQNFGELIPITGIRINNRTMQKAVRDMNSKHMELYGYSMEDRVVEITELRVILLGGKSVVASLSAPKKKPLRKFSTREVYFESEGFIDTPVYRRETIGLGKKIKGPAIIEEMDSTTLVHPGCSLQIGVDGSLLITHSKVFVGNTIRNKDIFSAKDPATLTVVDNALRNICDEMGSAMIRTAYSPIFSESRDFSCLLFDRFGRMIGQAEMNPAIMCAGLHTVPHCIEEVGKDNFFPGDVVVHNDPYRGQCHMPEHLLLKPVFLAKELVGFAGNIAHIGEIGGMAIGSFASTATEVFQEGLRIPPVKLMSEGKYVKEVWRIMMANHRTPDATWGDFHAILGSLNTAEDRLQGLINRYGLQKFEKICDTLIDHADKWMRNQIKRIPNGTYTGQDYFEDDGVVRKRYYFRSEVHVSDRDIVIDLSKSDKQALGPINVTYVATAAAGCTAVLQSIKTKGVPLNSGVFKPIKVIAPPGTIVNPIFPAPSVAGNTEGQPRIISCVQMAMAKALPGEVGAAEGGTACNLLMGGIHPDTGDFWAHYQLDGGGWGGRPDRDGNNAQCIPHGSTIRSTPSEVFETRYPLRVLEYSLRNDSGGAGKFRGGLGVRRLFEVTAPSITLSALLDRTEEGPWGLLGGLSGAPAAILVKTLKSPKFRSFVDEFNTVSPTKFINITLNQGDQLLLLAPGGGGYGNPRKRNKQLLDNDLADRFVTAKSQRKQYLK
ncbi:MAG: hypothetical protein CMD67_04495 [Gammaproteobacteria bacterium]|nr:hypothetical protein [Gammaproteobacteria bacterium]